MGLDFQYLQHGALAADTYEYHGVRFSAVELVEAIQMIDADGILPAQNPTGDGNRSPKGSGSRIQAAIGKMQLIVRDKDLGYYDTNLRRVRLYKPQETWKVAEALGLPVERYLG
jgi:hypothetical protein